MCYGFYLLFVYEVELDCCFLVIYWLYGLGGFLLFVFVVFFGCFYCVVEVGVILQVIVVFLYDGYGQNMWVDLKDGKVLMECVVFDELILYVDVMLCIVVGVSGCIFEGGSMGGYGVVCLGFKVFNCFVVVLMFNLGLMQFIFDLLDVLIVGGE